MSFNAFREKKILTKISEFTVMQIYYRYISESDGESPDIVALTVNRVKFKAIQHCFDIIGFKPEVSQFMILMWSMNKLFNP